MLTPSVPFLTTYHLSVSTQSKIIILSQNQHQKSATPIFVELTLLGRIKQHI